MTKYVDNIIKQATNNLTKHFRKKIISEEKALIIRGVAYGMWISILLMMFGGLIFFILNK